nr:MAG TPA: hypothetical protein [Bacteriophage sp.]
MFSLIITYILRKRRVECVFFFKIKMIMVIIIYCSFHILYVKTL